MVVVVGLFVYVMEVGHLSRFRSRVRVGNSQCVLRAQGSTVGSNKVRYLMLKGDLKGGHRIMIWNFIH